MVEIDTFQNGSAVGLTEDEKRFKSLNDQAAALRDKTEPTPEAVEVKTSTAFVDAEKGEFVTSRGNRVALSGKQITSLMLERIINEGKPKIPMAEVLILGKHKQMEARPNDPGYLALLEEWKADQNIRAMRYTFVVGTKGKPPDDFVEEQRQFFEDATDTEIKYLWVTSLIPDIDIDKFSEAILGQTLTTTKGLEEAANFSASK